MQDKLNISLLNIIKYEQVGYEKLKVKLRLNKKLLIIDTF